MSTENEKQVGLDAALQHVEETYTTRDPFEILSDESEEPPEIWGGLTLQRSQLMEVIGQSGLGKSRLILNLAINQILGRPFAGLPVYDQPLTWLFFGNENSFYRYRYDLRKMISILNGEEQAKLRGRIWLPTVENPGDSYISFADDKNIEKFKATIRLRKPDVLVLDPWGAIIDGDELNDQDVRRTLSMLLDAINEVSTDKPLPVIILNHSRNGAGEMAKAFGPEAANFGKNSKAIFTVMRNVWNLRRGNDEGEDQTVVELIHAKCSDRPIKGRKAVQLNSNNLHYFEVPNFDHDAWQVHLEKLAKSRSQLSPQQKSEASNRQKEVDTAKILNIFDEAPSIIQHAEFIQFAMDAGIAETAAKNIKTQLVTEGILVEVMRRNDSVHFYGTPEKARFMVSNHPKQYAYKNKTKVENLSL